MRRFTYQAVSDAINSSLSMAEAGGKLGCQYKTLRSYALKYGLWEPNQAGKGIKKKQPSIGVYDIISGKRQFASTCKLKNKLLKEGIFLPKCNKCNVEQWLGQSVSLELEHKDGNSRNHLLENLELLCPNCYAQTATYRGKNRKPCGLPVPA